MSTWGMPYMGSKDGIVASIALNFPSAENFYDLFGGGFSVSHYMLVNKAHKYKTFHYNEIKSDIVELVKRAIAGEFNYSRFKPPWVSREDFIARKDTDAYVRLIWSFGNNQKNYLFGENIEPYKKSLHMAIVFEEFDDVAVNVLKIKSWPKNVDTITKRRIYLSQRTAFDKPHMKPIQLQQLEQLQQLQRLQQLLQLEQLQRLQRLQQLQQLGFSSLSYRDVTILPNSVVYCDIPYKGTAGYISSFNHDEFYEWALSRPFPVYISEYEMPKDFELVYEIDKKTRLSGKGMTDTKPERLYWNGK